MQSADYVPGVSGWKIHDHVRLELNEGNRRVHAEVKMITTAGPGQTNDQAARSMRPCGGSVTAQGYAVSKLTTRVTNECESRAYDDIALAKRVGSIQCSMNGSADLHVRPEEATEPLRMGKVVFYGETARQIRAAQTVLRQAGAGQLEVVKRANEQGELFVVIDGQAFVSGAMVKNAVVDPGKFEVRIEANEKGQHYAVGFGVGVEQAAGSTAEAPTDAGKFLNEITKQITETEFGTSLESRIAQIELSRVAERGQKDAAEILIQQRLSALEETFRRLIKDELKPGGMLHRA